MMLKIGNLAIKKPHLKPWESLAAILENTDRVWKRVFHHLVKYPHASCGFNLLHYGGSEGEKIWLNPLF